MERCSRRSRWVGMWGQEPWSAMSLRMARQAKAVDDDVNFGAQPASRASDGVVRTPFFPPAACWWARTTEESRR